MLRKICRNPQAMTGLVMIAAILLAALLAPLLAPNDPTAVNIANTYAKTSAQYPLGTDEMGRCVLSRLLYGARYSLGIAAPTLLLLAVFSTVISTACAYIGGRIDGVFSAVCDVFMAFPPLLIAVTLIGSLGQGITNIIISIVFSMWVWFARIVRTFVLQEKNKEYVTACRVAGCSGLQIVAGHILPNVLPQLIVYFSTGVASIVLTVSGYAFLGFGFETGTPEWGAMFSQASSYLYSHPMLIVYPGLCIIFTTAGFNLFGEALRDIISPEEA